MFSSLAWFLVRRHLWLFGIALATLLVSIPIAGRLDLNWSVEGMFPADDPVVKSYRQLQERFGANDICLAVYHDPELWESSGEGLDRLEVVTKQIAGIEGVQSAISLSELRAILQKVRGPMGLFRASEVSPLLDPDDALAQSLASVFEGYTHNRNSNYVAIVCLLSKVAGEQKVGPSNHEATLARLRTQMQNLPAPAGEGVVAGEPVLVSEGFRMVQRDGVRLGFTCSIIVSLVLLLCFRSLRWTLIPLAVVHWSLLLTKAALVGLAMDLTMISSTLTSIVTVIGVATSIHLLLSFQAARRSGMDRPEAMQETLAKLLQPIMWACVTDAVGFCALMFADVGPVRDFGLMMAVGSIAVFFAIVFVVPALALFGKLDTDPSTPKVDLYLRLLLRKLLATCLRHRGISLVALLLLFAISLYGSLLVQVETDFTKNFHSESSLMQGYDLIEEELGGAGVWDIMVPAPEVIGNEYLAAIGGLQKELRAIEVESEIGPVRLTKVLSVVDAIEALDSDTMAALIPKPMRLQLMQATMSDFTSAMITGQADQSGYRWLRIMLRSQERIPASEKAALVSEVEAVLQSTTKSADWQSVIVQQRESQAENPIANGQIPASQIAGYHVMLGRLVRNVLDDQWRCFLIATAGVLVCMCLAVRSLPLAIATLVPNALPILLVLGFYGWTGWKANMGVALIAAVSLGLSIDSSIHYLTHYQRKKREGANAKKAMRSAQENVGLAAVLATVALIAGFASLCISEFAPTVVFGGLAAFTMLGGLLGNLVILPLLIAPRKK
ncbi:MAG: MMPL family transporter [Planctomycetota bacterium]